MLIDITVSKDIESNPGPSEETSNHDNILLPVTSGPEQQKQSQGVIAREKLLSLRRYRWKPQESVLITLKELGILKYRSNRRRKRGKYSSEFQSIPVVKTRRLEGRYARHFQGHSSYINLITVPRAVLPKERSATTSSRTFAVPKFLFVNVCSLMKTKNRIRSSVTLEADLHNNDVDICVVSETHLKPDVPDAAVNISNYSMNRRDRNWGGRDMRKNGGIAVYVRNNITVSEVHRSNDFELIAITIELPGGHHMLVCGLYLSPSTLQILRE